MTKIKLGIVGIGKIARDQHLPVLRAHCDFELVAAASRNAVVEGLQCYASLAEMLAAHPDLDAVSLCTPPGPRETDARLALRHGLHVLLEKPPASTRSAVLELIACAKSSILNASYHSRHAAGVEPARLWIQARRLQRIEIDWKEDIRLWHPGQDWILDAGGMGVFDPGINALSILTSIVAEPLVLEHATLGFCEGRHAPVTADLALRTYEHVPIQVSLSFLQEGPQTWSIRVVADDGELELREGGAVLLINDAAAALRQTPHQEYVGVYDEFARCVRAQRSNCDISPLDIVADAFVMGKRASLPAIAF